MTKTYTMPTWEEFWTAYRDAARQVSEVDYKTIREALAVEQPESERLVGKARGEERRCPVDNTVCDCDPEDACYVSKGSNPDWRDAGGGEEKPVRATAEPAANTQRCGNCKFWNYPKQEPKWGDNSSRFECLRHPPPFDYTFPERRGPTTHADMWCGEWRAK